MHSRLTEFRKALNLTKTDVAKAIGLRQSSYTDMENGKSVITERTIISICSRFNVNENWLRYGEGDMFNITDKKFNEFFDIYIKLKEPLQRYILNNANELLKLQDKL